MRTRDRHALLRRPGGQQGQQRRVDGAAAQLYALHARRQKRQQFCLLAGSRPAVQVEPCQPQRRHACNAMQGLGACCAGQTL